MGRVNDTQHGGGERERHTTGNGDRRPAGGGGEFDADTSRRTFLGLAGAAGAGALTGRVGDLRAQDIGTIRYGVLSPMTGPYGGLAQGQRQGAKLAVRHVNQSDQYDFRIEAFYDDTEAAPATGRRKAQKVVDQNDVSYLMGAISSSTALALNEFAESEEVIYNPGAAAVAITGEQCNEYVFRAETSAAQIAEAMAPWTVQNVGTRTWFHIADYAYGNSVLQEWRSRMSETSDQFAEVGVSRSQFGATNFGSYISQISNSDAEVVVIGMTGGDLINFVKQAANQGLKEQVALVGPTMTFQVVLNALGPAAAGTYGGVRYLPKLRTGDNQSFVDAYRKANGNPPDNFARVAYDSIRMTAQGIQETGSSDPEEVKDTLAGLQVDSVFGPNRFRECDHQAMNPVWAGENVAANGGGMNVELRTKVEGPQAIPPCNETGCNI